MFLKKSPNIYIFSARLNSTAHCITCWLFGAVCLCIWILTTCTQKPPHLKGTLMIMYMHACVCIFLFNTRIYTPIKKHVCMLLHYAWTCISVCICKYLRVFSVGYIQIHKSTYIHTYIYIEREGSARRNWSKITPAHLLKRKKCCNIYGWFTNSCQRNIVRAYWFLSAL